MREGSFVLDPTIFHESTCELIVTSPNVTRSYPIVEIGKKKIILLSGFERASGAKGTLAITAKDQLEEAAKRHRDAVAFGYVSGMWIAAP